MTKLEYAAYLQSQHWRTISRLVRERDGGRCVLCGSESRLHVHHRTYDGYPYGESMSDLCTLCEECHAAVTKMLKERDGG